MFVAAVGVGYVITCVVYPSPLVSRELAVGRLLGLPLEAAQREIASQGFRLRLENPEPDPVIPAGHVVWQDPPPGTTLAKGAMVHLTMSSGPATVAVPDVVGFDLEAARDILRVAGLRLGRMDSLVSPAEAGVIITTRPATGESRAPGTTVDLVVSRGLADIRVPDLLGATREEARQRLESWGLKVGTIVMRDRGRGPARPGGVVEQRPAAGMLSARGGRVNLVISR